MRKLIVVLLLSVLPICLSAQQQWPKSATSAAQQQKLNQAYKYLSGAYVDDVDMAPLVESAIRSMIEELDPHSLYIDAEEMKGVKESFDGEFSGIGVEFNVLQDTVIVVNTIVGGPAEKVGVMPNDRIVKIDTVNAVGFRQIDVPKYLRGKSGTRVDIDVVRHGESAPLHFSIIRDKIPINTVDAAYMVDKHTGYIKVNRFGNTTMSEFYEAFRKFGVGMDALIVDLRGNGGGLLEQAVEMSNFFLPKGSTIVSTEGRVVPTTMFNANQDGKFLNGKVVVLVDENSASASEIVAGALQDWDRGIIIGRPSFGKGLVQRQFMLGDGSAMRVTMARYHTPSGRVIQRPYEKGKRDEYYKEHYSRFGVDSIKSDSLKNRLEYKTLRTARTMYGGGGITPDIITPVDTTGVSDYIISLTRRGVINEYIVSYLDVNRQSLAGEYTTFERYDASFDVTDDMLSALTALGEQRDVKFDKEGFDISKELIKRQLKAIMAQKLFDTTAFYRVINNSDNPMYSRAVELLRNWAAEATVILGDKK